MENQFDILELCPVKVPGLNQGVHPLPFPSQYILTTRSKVFLLFLHQLAIGTKGLKPMQNPIQADALGSGFVDKQISYLPPPKGLKPAIPVIIFAKTPPVGAPANGGPKGQRD